MHWSFVSDVFYVDSFDGLFIRILTFKLTRLAVDFWFVLRGAHDFSAISRFDRKRLILAPLHKTVIPVPWLGIRCYLRRGLAYRDYCRFMPAQLLNTWSRKLPRWALLRAYVSQASAKRLSCVRSKIITAEKVTGTSLRQRNALGLGYAVLCAKHLFYNEPFAVLLPEVLVLDKESRDINYSFTSMVGE